MTPNRPTLPAWTSPLSPRFGDRFDADEAAVAEKMLRESAGTLPVAQLIEEVWLAIAIRCRGQ